MKIFVCVILIALGNGEFKTVIPTGEVWKSVEDCQKETEQYAKDDDVNIFCLSVKK